MNKNVINSIIIVVGTALAAAVACIPTKQAAPLHWEYKFLYEEVASEDPKLSNGIQVKEDDLNVLGKDGWELATSYLELETAFPNFGEQAYITGIQSNVRPKRAVLVFKRPQP